WNEGKLMRSLCSLVLPVALLLSSQAIAQSGYPDRPIKMIVPLAAASAVDGAARIVTQKMADNIGQQIVILNLPGASGLIGAEQVARAEPDGYTIGGFNDSIMTMVPNLQSKMRWDILKDFEPVSLVATVEWGLIAHNSGKLQERSRPDRGGEGGTRQDRLWLGRAGKPAASGDGDVRVGCRHIADACALQRRHPSRYRRRRRPDSCRLSGLGHGRSAGARRSSQADRGDHREEIGAIPRCCARLG